MMEFEALREQYPRFVYEGYEIEENDEAVRVVYDFLIPGMEAHFRPTWTWTRQAGMYFEAGSPVVQRLLFSLGMTELISYWKCACPPTVIVRAGELTEAQIVWWKKLYFHGLGEFFYTNGIETDEVTFMNIVCEPEGRLIDGPEPFCYCNRTLSGAMIPVGGGKDSVVTMDLLKDLPGNMAYCINSRGATDACVAVAGYEGDAFINVRRTIDRNLLRLNQEGFLNGHTPFSAIVAFSSVLTAYFYGKKYVALSNESSANESTVKNSKVNHQYSKSFEFELDFHEYEKTYIQSGVHYFSMLRPLSEYQIAKLFARCKAFHPVFKSCNAGSKQDIWCGHCPKCMFVFMILSPFLSMQELTGIFGTNMLEDATMEHTMEELTGAVENKPFECVGSRNEVNAAICKAIQNIHQNGENLPLLYKKFADSAFYEQYKNEWKYYEQYYDKAHLIPSELEEILLRRLAGEGYEAE